MSAVSITRRARNCAARVIGVFAADFRTAAQMVGWRISLPLLKRILKIGRLAELMWSPPARRLDDNGRRERVALVTRLVVNGGRLMVSSNCLERSLVLYGLLSRADSAPSLVLGVRQDGSLASGHAWVELNGRPLGQHDSKGFTPIVTFGPYGQTDGSLPTRLA